MERGTGGPPIAKTSPRTHASGPCAARLRVLLAEDDEDARRIVSAWLTDDGFDVVAVADGAAALEALARAADGGAPPFDVVVLDFVLPGISGIGILGAMRRFPRRPPTIVMTAFPDGSVETMARRFGAIEVLRKPIDLDRLTALVAESASPLPSPAARQA